MTGHADGAAALLERCRRSHQEGRYADALAEARELMTAVAGARHAEACAVAAGALAELGDQVGALEILRRAAQAGPDHETGTILDLARGNVLVIAARCAEALSVLEPAMTRAQTLRLGVAVVDGLGALAEALTACERHRDAIRAAADCIARQDPVPAPLPRSRPHVALAAAHLGLGDVARADAHVGAALEMAQDRGERGWEGRARLVAAEIAARRGDRRSAQWLLDEAQDIADELAMMPLIERCRALSRRLR